MEGKKSCRLHFSDFHGNYFCQADRGKSQIPANTRGTLDEPRTTNALTSKLSRLSELQCNSNSASELLEQLSSGDIDRHLENVLEVAKTLDITCAFDKCKARTNLMGQHCEYCKKDYCFKHGLPEIHGCGEAVKRDERKKFLQQKPAKVIRQEQDLAKAKKKLEAKLKDMQVSRKPGSTRTTKKNQK